MYSLQIKYTTNLMAGIFIFPVLLKSGSRAPFLSRRYKMPVYIEHNIIRMRHPVPYKYTWCMCMFDSLALLTDRVGLVKPWVSQLCPALVSFLSTLCSFPLSWMDQEGPAYVRTCHKQCSVLFPHNNYKWHTICRLFDGNWSSTSLFSLLWKQT